MKKTLFVCAIAAIAIGLVACRAKRSSGQPEKVNEASAQSETVVTDDALTGKHWKLTEILGEDISAYKDVPEAYIVFEKTDNRVHGNNSCNSFSGNYTLKPNNRIAFSQMISTLKMCLNNRDIESRMKQTLEIADHYLLRGDTLVLHRARMAPLAKFAAVSE